MSMNSRITTLACGIGLAVVLGIFDAASAQADRIFSNRDLRGEYKFSLNEAERLTQPDAIQYCNSFGSAFADGAGNLTVSQTARCYVDGHVTTEQSMELLTYDVRPDGEVFFYSEDQSGGPTHGVLVNGGNTILIDGTARTGGWIYQHGTASRLFWDDDDDEDDD